MSSAYDAAHVCCHLGYGYGPFAEAQLGLLWDEVAAPIVPVKPTKRRPEPETQWAPSSGGAGWIVPVPSSFEITETSLVELAERSALFSRSPELRTWVSAVLSQAGRSGVPLDTEAGLANVLLSAVRRAALPVGDPTVRALYLASGFLALGLPAALVAHGDLTLERLLTAVRADKRWWYADPSSRVPFGRHEPFTREHVVHLPDLAAEGDLAELRKRVEAQEREILFLKAELADALEEVQAVAAAPRTVVVVRDEERVYRALAFGALGLLAVARRRLGGRQVKS